MSLSVVTASVAEQIAEVVSNAILTGKLVPGELYSVEQVAKKLDLPVSRTPVREALVRLAEAGVVRAETNRGYRILELDMHDLEELFQLRLMLEVPAAYRAAQRADQRLIDSLEAELLALKQIAAKASEDVAGETMITGPSQRDLEFVDHDTRFHGLVLQAAGNQRLVDLVNRFRFFITVKGAWRLQQSREGGLEEVMREHEPVLDALKNHDSQAAAKAMYYHLEKTGNGLMEHLEREAHGTFDRQWLEGVAIPSP